MAQHGQSSNCRGAVSTPITLSQPTSFARASRMPPARQENERILNVGCGLGIITMGLAKYACEGKTVGIDVSTNILQKAKNLAAVANVPTEGPGSVVFEQGNILERLVYPDDTFDIVFCSQPFGHLLPLYHPRHALAKMRRVLKPGGILATRNAADSHFTRNASTGTGCGCRI